jgi:hypothetical protein
MLLIIRQKADKEILEMVAKDLDGYVKVTVDIRKKTLSAGGQLHVDGEKVLMEDGGKQADIWGGGIDFDTGEIDFDSTINMRSAQRNKSREVLSLKIRGRMKKIIKNLLR